MSQLQSQNPRPRYQLLAPASNIPAFTPALGVVAGGWGCSLSALCVCQENKAPEADTSRLHVGHLTRNVQQEHIHEIFSTFGTVKHVELAMDKAVNLPRGFAYVEFSKRSEAEEAQRLMDGGQLDGNQLRHAW